MRRAAALGAAGASSSGYAGAGASGSRPGASGAAGTGAGRGARAGGAAAAAAGAPGGGAPLRLHPFTLSFGDPALEAAYVRHQEESQLAFDKSVHAFHIAIAVLHTGYSAYAATGGLTSPAALSLTLPYITIALLHWALSRTRTYARARLPLVIILEAAYQAVCTLSMSKWVLLTYDRAAAAWVVAPATSGKYYLKDFILGSGVLISTWVTVFCVKPVFWVHYITIPLEYAFQTATLTAPVCATLTAAPYGRAVTLRAAALLDAAAAVGALAAPSCPPRGGPGGAPAAAACAGMLRSWEVACCAALLYGKYRLERAARLKFAASMGWGPVRDPWPLAPPLVQVLVHVSVLVHVLCALWVWLGCAPAPAAA